MVPSPFVSARVGFPFLSVVPRCPPATSRSFPARGRRLCPAVLVESSPVCVCTWRRRPQAQNPQTAVSNFFLQSVPLSNCVKSLSAVFPLCVPGRESMMDLVDPLSPCPIKCRERSNIFFGKEGARLCWGGDSGRNRQRDEIFICLERLVVRQAVNDQKHNGRTWILRTVC